MLWRDWRKRKVFAKAEYLSRDFSENSSSEMSITSRYAEDEQLYQNDHTSAIEALGYLILCSRCHEKYI